MSNLGQWAAPSSGVTGPVKSVGFVGPRTTSRSATSRTTRVAPPRSVTGTASSGIRRPFVARDAYTSYYDPSRVIERDQLTLVDSIAAERALRASDQNSAESERGELVTELDTDYDAAVSAGGKPLLPEFEADMQETNQGLKVIGALVAAYFLFG